MSSFNTPEQISAYQAIVIAKGCKLYAKTGMVPNRAYTATKMLKAAGSITGKAYKRGQHMQAHDDIMENFTS